MDLAKYTDLIEGRRTIKEFSRDEMIEIIALMEEMEKREDYSGHHRMYVPGTLYGIDMLPKHREFFKATKMYKEILLLGGNRCKIAGTKVWMADGSEKNIEDCIVGDEVLAYDITTANLVKSTVVDTFTGYADNIYWYNSDRNGAGFGATDDHEILSVRSGYPPEKRRLKDMAYYDKAIVPSSWKKEGVVPNFTEDQAALLGLLVGDGYLCARDSAYKLTNKDEDIISFAERVASDMDLKTRRVTYGNGWTDLFFTKGYKSNRPSNLALLLDGVDLLGTRSGTKFVPEKILNAPESYVRSFIRGLLAADGCYSKGRIDLWTTSELLAITYQKALLRLGVCSSYSTKRHKNPNHKDCHRVTVSGDHYTTKIGDSFHKKVILADTKKKVAFHKTRVLKQSHKLPAQNIYCITLDHKDHLFIANGFVTGNSGKTMAGAEIVAVLTTG